MSPSETATRRDRIRQIVVVVAAVTMLIGTLAGVGLLGGTPIQSSVQGAFSSDASLLTPAGPAFSIWSVIYLGLAAFTVWHCLAPIDRRARRIGWLAAASMVLNAAWLLVVQAGWIWLSVVVIAALAIDLGILVQRLGGLPTSSWGIKLVLDGTFGLYLGWVSVATVANITAALTGSAANPGGRTAEFISVAVLVVVVALAGVFANKLGARWAVSLAMAWGLAWIAVARLTGGTPSRITAVTAAAAALIILLVTPGRRWPTRIWSSRRPSPQDSATLAGGSR
jgi:hypothetical protein